MWSQLVAFALAAVPWVAADNSKSANGPDKDGKYWIYGDGLEASFIPYGASISNLLIKDRHGIQRDVVGGFDNASYYAKDTQHPHFGGVPGRYANRIKNSSFVIDGETYHVTPNDNPTAASPKGADTLHGGPDGWDYRNFTVVAYTKNSITFSIKDPDGKEGFPGEVISYITYTLTGQDWDIKMVALATTKKTPIMLSSHTYWNLDGFANNETNKIFNHTLHLPYSGQRVGVDNILIPTGEILANTKGSVNDFWSKPKQIGSANGDPGLKNNCAPPRLRLSLSGPLSSPRLLRVRTSRTSSPTLVLVEPPLPLLVELPPPLEVTLLRRRRRRRLRRRRSPTTTWVSDSSIKRFHLAVT